MKQIALAGQMYSQDYNEEITPFLVPGVPNGLGRWGALLQPYVMNEQVFACPNQRHVPGPFRPDWVA